MTRLVFTLDMDGYGGSEIYVERLVEGLPADYKVAFVAHRPVPEKFARAARRLGVELRTVREVRHLVDPAAAWAMARELKQTRPDVVHANLQAPALNRHAVVAAASRHIPQVAVVHTWVRPAGDLRIRVVRGVLCRPHIVLVPTTSLRRDLVDVIGLDERKVRIVPIGIPRWERAVPSARQDRPLRIGGVGRLVRLKGWDLLIDAVRSLTESGRTVEAVIAGDGSDRDRLMSSARGLPIEFAGYVEDVARFLAQVDVFCMPSRQEVAGTALLEAMGMGLACVATNAGGIPEQLGDAGILVPPEDPKALATALGRLLDSRPLRSSLGEKAQARAVERFSVERMVRETVAAYRDALERAT